MKISRKPLIKATALLALGGVRSAFSPQLCKLIREAAFAVFAALAIALPAGAQSPKLMKFAHIFPASHYLWQQGGLVVANQVEKASGGRIKFEVYPAGQLGKDYYALLRSGVADVVMLVPSYAPEKLPLTSVAELPGLYSTACEGTTRLWNIAKPGGMLNETEYKSLGLHMLFVTVLPSYGLFTTTKATPNLEALKGLKIRANGAAMDKSIRALGAVPVRVPSPELYDALTRGTVDGAFFPYQGLPTYSLEKVLKHSVSGTQLGAGSVLYAMTEKGWSGMPQDVRDIMNKASVSTQASLCKWQDGDDAKVRERIVAQDGHVMLKLAPDEAARWKERVSNIASDWAREMDAAGKKGSELLRVFKNAPVTQ